MTDNNQWAFSIDGETWEGPFERPVALSDGNALAIDGDHKSFQIGIVVPIDVGAWEPQVEDVLCDATEQIRDNVWHEAESIDVTQEQTEALQVLLTAAWRSWVEIFGITHSAFTVRDVQKIDVVETDS